MSFATERRPVGRTGLAVSRLGLGGGSLINATGADGVRAIIEAGWQAGLRFFDTAALYAAGESERRFGVALRERPRAEFVLSTKVGRFAGAGGDIYDYSAAGTEAAVAASLQRLGLAHIDITFIHDVIPALHGIDFERRFAEAMAGAWPVLRRMREQGRVRAVGVALRDPAVAYRFLQEADFDCVMLAGGWTLLQHEALEVLLPYCKARQVTVLIAAPFNSGILATGPITNARYEYRPAPPEILERVRRLQNACERCGVSLAAAALHFPLRHPAVASVVVGHQSMTELATNLRLLAEPIPDAVWDTMAVEGLVPRNAA